MFGSSRVTLSFFFILLFVKSRLFCFVVERTTGGKCRLHTFWKQKWFIDKFWSSIHYSMQMHSHLFSSSKGKSFSLIFFFLNFIIFTNIRNLVIVTSAVYILMTHQNWITMSMMKTQTEYIVWNLNIWVRHSSYD